VKPDILWPSPLKKAKIVYKKISLTMKINRPYFIQGSSSKLSTILEAVSYQNEYIAYREKQRSYCGGSAFEC
jgi:hypothetical protein